LIAHPMVSASAPNRLTSGSPVMSFTRSAYMVRIVGNCSLKLV
jgi:hypothetical protein